MFYVYGKPNCVWCTAAKELLKQHNLEYFYFEIGVNLTREEFIKEFPDVKSVPLIFEGATRIGGYNELAAYLPQLDLDNL